MLLKKCVSFTAVHIMFVHPLCMLPSYIPWGDWINYVEIYRGADKSLAQPGKKQATATEDFEFHISYL